MHKRPPIPHIAHSPDRALEECRVLRDDGDGRPQVVQPDVADVHAVDLHRARVQLGQAEQRGDEARLAGAGATDDADLRFVVDSVKRYFKTKWIGTETCRKGLASQA